MENQKLKLQSHGEVDLLARLSSNEGTGVSVELGSQSSHWKKEESRDPTESCRDP